MKREELRRRHLGWYTFEEPSFVTEPADKPPANVFEAADYVLDRSLSVAGDTV